MIRKLDRERKMHASIFSQKCYSCIQLQLSLIKLTFSLAMYSIRDRTFQIKQNLR